MLLTIPTPKYKVLYSIVSPTMLALTAVLLLNFLSVCLSQNRKSVEKSIQSIFQLLVLDRKHCKTKQVSHELKFKKPSACYFCCYSAMFALNHGPTNFGFRNCRSIRNKSPLIHNLIKCSKLDTWLLQIYSHTPGPLILRVTSILSHHLICYFRSHRILGNTVVLLSSVEKPSHL